MRKWRNRYRKLGRAAYETIRDIWNAEHAAKELVRFAECLLHGNIAPAQSGPLSVAEPVRPGKMYRAMIDGVI